jgi:hypothetical protein
LLQLLGIQFAEPWERLALHFPFMACVSPRGDVCSISRKPPIPDDHATGWIMDIIDMGKFSVWIFSSHHPFHILG